MSDTDCVYFSYRSRWRLLPAAFAGNLHCNCWCTRLPAFHQYCDSQTCRGHTGENKTFPYIKQCHTSTFISFTQNGVCTYEYMSCAFSYTSIWNQHQKRQTWMRGTIKIRKACRQSKFLQPTLVQDKKKEEKRKIKGHIPWNSWQIL